MCHPVINGDSLLKLHARSLNMLLPITNRFIYFSVILFNNVVDLLLVLIIYSLKIMYVIVGSNYFFIVQCDTVLKEFTWATQNMGGLHAACRLRTPYLWYYKMKDFMAYKSPS
jgi:hypothetical protein